MIWRKSDQTDGCPPGISATELRRLKTPTMTSDRYCLTDNSKLSHHLRSSSCDLIRIITPPSCLPGKVELQQPPLRTIWAALALPRTRFETAPQLQLCQLSFSSRARTRAQHQSQEGGAGVGATWLGWICSGSQRWILLFSPLDILSKLVLSHSSLSLSTM